MRKEDLWEEVIFDLKELAQGKAFQGEGTASFKGPEAGTAGMFEEQKGYCGWRGVVKGRVEGSEVGDW